MNQVNYVQPCADPEIKTQRRDKNEALYNKLLKGKLDHLSWQESEKIDLVLRLFAYVFHDVEVNDFKATTVAEHEIVLENPTPISRPLYKTPFALKDEMKA